MTDLGGAPVNPLESLTTKQQVTIDVIETNDPPSVTGSDISLTEPNDLSSLISLNIGNHIDISDQDDVFLQEVKISIDGETYLPSNANAVDTFIFPETLDGFVFTGSDGNRIVTISSESSKTLIEFNNVLNSLELNIQGDDPTGLDLFPNRKIIVEATDKSGDTTNFEFNIDINATDDLPELTLGSAGSVTDISVAIEDIPLFVTPVVFNEVDTRYDKFSIEMIGGMEGEDNLLLHTSTADDIVEIFNAHLDANLSTVSKLVFDFSSLEEGVSQNNTDLISSIINNLAYENKADIAVGLSAGNRTVEVKLFENVNDTLPTVERVTDEFIVGARFDGENPTELAFGPQSILNALEGRTVDEIKIEIDYGNSSPDIFDRLVIDTSLIESNDLEDVRLEIAPQTVSSNLAQFVFPASAIMIGSNAAFSAEMTADILRSAIQFTNEYLMNTDLRTVTATVTPTDLLEGEIFDSKVRTSVTVDETIIPKIKLSDGSEIDGEYVSMGGLWNQPVSEDDTMISIDYGYVPADHNAISFQNLSGVIGTEAADMITASGDGFSDKIAGMGGDDIILGSGDDQLRYDIEFSVSEALRIRDNEGSVSVKTPSWNQLTGMEVDFMTVKTIDFDGQNFTFL